MLNFFGKSTLLGDEAIPIGDGENDQIKAEAGRHWSEEATQLDAFSMVVFCGRKWRCAVEDDNEIDIAV